jgi:hypothetical protein
MKGKALARDPSDGSALAPGDPRTCPECGRAIQEPSESSTQFTVLQKGMVVERGGQVIGQVIEKLVERPLTPEEKKDLARGLELGYLREGVIACVQGIERGWKAKDVGKGNPYKGLVAYGLSDAEFFFGRDLAIAELLDCLHNNRLTVLHAESGAGKTSLLQAGIAPQLLASQRLPVRIRALDENPTVAVKKTFLRDLDSAPRLAEVPLRDFLHHVDTMLGLEMGLFVFLDQFEEFFTRLAPSERPGFVTELAECLDDSVLDVGWVIALRSEFFGQLSRFEPDVYPFKNGYLLERLSKEEAQEVVVKPAALRGVRFERGLADKLLSVLDVDGVQPSQLQLVCSALWERREREETAITHMPEGGVEGILKGYLNDVVSKQFGELEKPARRVLEALVTHDGRRDLLTRDELAVEIASLEVTPDAFDKILERLVSSRLLQVEKVDRGDTKELAYELVHDYLVNEIELDHDRQARKLVQEMLREANEPWRREKGHGMTQEELETVYPHRKELPKIIDQDKRLQDVQDVLIRSALREGYSVGDWLEALGERPQDVETVRAALLSEDEKEQNRAQIGIKGRNELPQSLRGALESELRQGEGAQRRRAAEVLWPWRRSVEKGLRPRLRLERLHGWARQQGRQHWRELSFALLVVVIVAVLGALGIAELDRRAHVQFLTEAILTRRQEFHGVTSPGNLHYDGEYVWAAGWQEDWWDGRGDP